MLGVCFVTSSSVLGVDLWRVHGPAMAMQQLGWPVGVVPLGRDVPLLDGKAPDVLVCSQRASAKIGAYEHMRERLCRPNRMLLVVDVCDDPTDRDSWVGERRAAAGVVELAQDAIRAADLVTVNSKPMAAICRQINPNVVTVPDLIDGTRWVPPAFVRADADSRMLRARARTWIGVAGGESHDEDWRVLAKVWPALAARHPGLGFVCIGHTPDYLAQSQVLRGRLISIPWLPVTDYQRAYAGLDIGCAPLADLKFNASKSPIKWYEYSMAGAATVASPTVYGTVIQNGVTGLLATTPEQWLMACERLLDRGYRQRLADAARKRVIDRHMLSEGWLRERMQAYQWHHARVYGEAEVAA